MSKIGREVSEAALYPIGNAITFPVDGRRSK
jgi:hypothetical protein